MKKGPTSMLPLPGGTRVLDLLANKQGFLLLRKGHFGPGYLRTPKSVCLSLCFRSGGGRPVCISAFPDGEHQSLTLGMKERVLGVNPLVCSLGSRSDA